MFCYKDWTIQFSVSIIQSSCLKITLFRGTNYFNGPVVKVQFLTQHEFIRAIVNADDKETFFTSDKALMNEDLLNSR